MLTCLLLSAGRSHRMGQPKAYLRLEGVTLLERIARAARDGGVARLIVVVGAEDDGSLTSARKVRALLGAQTECVVGRPDGTPIDSIRAALPHVGADDALMLWPVDTPFADSALVRRMISALESPDRIVAVRVGDTLAHPVLFGANAKAELDTPLADGGANGVVERAADRLITIECTDERIMLPLNTPEQAEALGVQLKLKGAKAELKKELELKREKDKGLER